tara:strand:+ start:187 stop:387 length:201 start_codon:yes stop_codon:yes gene_type:complete
LIKNKKEVNEKLRAWMRKNAPETKIPEVVPVVVVVPDDNNKPIDTNIPDADSGVSDDSQNGNETNP